MFKFCPKMGKCSGYHPVRKSQLVKSGRNTLALSIVTVNDKEVGAADAVH